MVPPPPPRGLFGLGLVLHLAGHLSRAVPWAGRKPPAQAAAHAAVATKPGAAHAARSIGARSARRARVPAPRPFIAHGDVRRQVEQRRSGLSVETQFGQSGAPFGKGVLCSSGVHSGVHMLEGLFSEGSGGTQGSRPQARSARNARIARTSGRYVTWRLTARIDRTMGRGHNSVTGRSEQEPRRSGPPGRRCWLWKIYRGAYRSSPARLGSGFWREASPGQPPADFRRGAGFDCTARPASSLE